MPESDPELKTVQIIGCPEDLGQAKRGVDMGPSAMRVAGVVEKLRALGHTVIDSGDIVTSDMASEQPGNPNLRWVDQVVKDMEVLADVVEAAVRAGRFPLVLGGDNSVSIGTMAGLARVEPRQGLIWVDAHPDFNVPETTPSGNIHGMPVAAIVGDGDPRLTEVGGVTPKVLEENLVWIALRDVDPRERDRVRASPATAYTMRDVDEMGMRQVTGEAINLATRGGVDQIHLCFDMDSIDPRHAPGTGAPVPGGLSYREAHLMMEAFNDAGIITSAEFVEVNPALDLRNGTAELAVELICSLLGKRIL
jgi:arginase